MEVKTAKEVLEFSVETSLNLLREGRIEQGCKILTDNNVVSVIIDTKPLEDLVLQDLPQLFTFMTTDIQKSRLQLAINRSFYPRGYEIKFDDNKLKWRYVFLHDRALGYECMPFIIETENMPFLETSNDKVVHFLSKALYTDKHITGLDRAHYPHSNRILGWKIQKKENYEFRVFL